MKTRRHDLVLSIYLNSGGFAFVLLEGPLAPFDWGVREFRGASRNQRLLVAVDALLLRFEPGLLILQETTPGQRSPRISEINACIAELAEGYAIPIRSYSRKAVRDAFGKSGLITKHAVAQAIAKALPAFERYLPPPRKPWMSADARMALFDAAALAATFYGCVSRVEAA